MGIVGITLSEVGDFTGGKAVRLARPVIEQI